MDRKDLDKYLPLPARFKKLLDFLENVGVARCSRAELINNLVQLEYDFAVKFGLSDDRLCDDYWIDHKNIPSANEIRRAMFQCVTHEQSVRAQLNQVQKIQPRCLWCGDKTGRIGGNRAMCSDCTEKWNKCLWEIENNEPKGGEQK